MIRLGLRLPSVRASSTLQLRTTAIPRAGSRCASTTSRQPGLVLNNGKAVLYRGPSAMKNWAYMFVGGTFVGMGFQLAYTLYNYMTWPLTWKDPENQPALVGLGKRMVAAFLVGAIGVGTGWLFFAVPTKTITKLTLDVAARQLIIRTSSREFSALVPRILYSGPLRKTAELHGYYKTDRINERVIPLSAVYRMRGSATSAGLNTARYRVSDEAKKGLFLDERQCLEIKIANERAWYRLESGGGADPPKGFGYRGFWRRIQHRLRAKTDWEGEEIKKGEDGLQLGAKEPWFADRRIFDDVIPLVKRK